MERRRRDILMSLAAVTLGVLFMLGGAGRASVIHVPSGEVPTIQSGIDMSADGGAIACRGPAHGFAMPVVRGCTLVTKSAASAGGGIVSSRNAYPKVTETILWNNSAEDGLAIALLGGEGPSGAIVSYSDVQGGELDVSIGPDCELFWTEGNIDCNPLFCDPYAGDHWPRDESCCAGAGRGVIWRR